MSLDEVGEVVLVVVVLTLQTRHHKQVASAVLLALRQE